MEASSYQYSRGHPEIQAANVLSKSLGGLRSELENPGPGAQGWKIQGLELKTQATKSQATNLVCTTTDSQGAPTSWSIRGSGVCFSGVRTRTVAHLVNDDRREPLCQSLRAATSLMRIGGPVQAKYGKHGRRGSAKRFVHIVHKATQAKGQAMSY